jgi:hypothetical protein
MYNMKIENKEVRTIFKEIINAVPTDGLGITDSDLQQFGGISTYEEVDRLLLDYFLGNENKSVYQPGLIKRQQDNNFKFVASKLPSVSRGKFHYETYGEGKGGNRCLLDKILESM